MGDGKKATVLIRRFPFLRICYQLRDIPAEDCQPHNIRVVDADVGEIDIGELSALEVDVGKR